MITTCSRLSILAFAGILLAAAGCKKPTAPRHLGPPVPKGFTPLPAAPPPPSIPTANSSSKKLQWLGPPLNVGEWETVPAIWMVTGWHGTPGDNYRVRLRWPGGLSAELCVIVGSIDPDEDDLDDTKELHRECPKPDAEGLTDVSVHVPPDGNVVMLMFHSLGRGPQNLDIRIDPS